MGRAAAGVPACGRNATSKDEDYAYRKCIGI